MVPHRRENAVRIGGIDRQVHRARSVVVAGQHLGPSRAAIGRIVDAALAAVVVELAGRGGENVLRIGRIHRQPADRARVRQPHELPCLAAVELIGRYPPPP